MSSNVASARGAATNARADAPCCVYWFSIAFWTCSDCESATSKPPPVNWFDCVSAR